MSHITIYTTLLCPYCYRAKMLLDEKGQTFTEIDVGRDPEKRIEMEQKSGGQKTVPQIWIGTFHVGGCDDLYALDGEGKLDDLLSNEQN